MEEKKQSAKEIRRILGEAWKENCFVNLEILNSKGEPKFTPDLLVEEIEENHVYLSYLDEKGNPGESIPLELSRIVKAELEIESYE